MTGAQDGPLDFRTLEELASRLAIPRRAVYVGDMGALRRSFAVDHEATPASMIAGIPIRVDEKLPADIVELREVLSGLFGIEAEVVTVRLRVS